MSNDLFDTVNPDHLIDTDPDRYIETKYGVFEIQFRELVRDAVAFGYGEGDDNDANERRLDDILDCIPNMTPAEVAAILYVVANASRDGAWDNMAKKVCR